MAEVHGTFTGVVIDGQKLAEVLRGPNGPVVRELIEAGELVKQEAKRRVGVYRPPDAYAAAQRKRRPGTLRDSIVKRVTSSGGIPVVQVGSEDHIAMLHHEGTPAHVIAARRRPALVFFWPKVGKVTVVPSPGTGRTYHRGDTFVIGKGHVNHPGTKPNRFLTDALAVLNTRYT